MTNEEYVDKVRVLLFDNHRLVIEGDAEALVRGCAQANAVGLLPIDAVDTIAKRFLEQLHGKLKAQREGVVEKKKVYWQGEIGPTDDFGAPYGNVMYDAQTHRGRWANMSEQSYQTFSIHRLGTGHGQKYKQQPDGRWLKVEG